MSKKIFLTFILVMLPLSAIAQLVFDPNPEKFTAQSVEGTWVSNRKTLMFKNKKYCIDVPIASFKRLRFKNYGLDYEKSSKIHVLRSKLRYDGKIERKKVKVRWANEITGTKQKIIARIIDYKIKRPLYDKPYFKALKLKIVFKEKQDFCNFWTVWDSFTMTRYKKIKHSDNN